MSPVQLLELNQTEADCPRDSTIADSLRSRPPGLRMPLQSPFETISTVIANSMNVLIALPGISRVSASSQTRWLASRWDDRKLSS